MEIERFIRFEDKYKLEKRETLGLHYWDFCRIFMFFFIQSEYDKTKNIIDLNSPKPSKKLSLSLLAKYGIFIKKSCDILLISDPRRYKVDNSYMSIFCDPISHIMEPKYNVITIEEPSWVAKYNSFPPHFLPTDSDNIIFADVFEHIYILKKKLFYLFHKDQLHEIEKELRWLYRCIYEEFKVDLPAINHNFKSFVLRSYDANYQSLIRPFNIIQLLLGNKNYQRFV